MRALCRSVQFNVYLFLTLAAGSAIGTVIPQNQPWPTYTKDYGEIGAKLLGALGFLDVYHSAWFVTLLGLLAFNVVVCKLTRMPDASVMPEQAQKNDPHATRLYRTQWTAAGEPKNLLQGIRRFLAARKFHLTEHRTDQDLTLVAERYRLQRWGSWISHISIFVVLFGGLISAVFGFEEVLNVVEGTAERMAHRPWTLQVDKFEVKFHEGTDTPKEFRSEVRLYEAHEEVAKTPLLVNHPLQHKGVRFYQASYGPYVKDVVIEADLRGRRKPIAVRAMPDQTVPIPGTPYSVRTVFFTPDLGLNEKAEPISRSSLPRNPAVHTLVFQNGVHLDGRWLMLRRPNMPPQEGDLRLRLTKYEPIFYSGVQVSYDPGVLLTLAGCGMLVLGLSLTFYLVNQRIWVRMEPNGRETRIFFTGAVNRGSLNPERVFRPLAQELMAAGRTVNHPELVEGCKAGHASTSSA